MAERKITVKLDSLQVQDLKDYVRELIERERQAGMRVAPASGDEALRARIQRLLDGLVEKYDESDDIRAGVVSMWLKGLLG